MSHVAEHYENLLAEHYTWMFGTGALEKAAEQRQLLERLGIGGGALAVDLGAGSGFQSIALADMGFKRVVAIDTSAKLLAELRSNRGARPVDVIQCDMMRLSEHIASASADVIVCMGDTLPHLPARDLIPSLFASIHRALRSDGAIVLTFRDLSAELRGTDRFIPVRSTADKIMTCFLEYGPEVVMVHDLVHIRAGDTWVLTKSSYPKLRLSVSTIQRELEQVGFQVHTQENIRGFSVLAARKA
jgi:SAM-dependent methyltransferase